LIYWVFNDNFFPHGEKTSAKCPNQNDFCTPRITIITMVEKPSQPSASSSGSTTTATSTDQDNSNSSKHSDDAVNNTDLLAAQALACSIEEWNRLGLGTDVTVIATNEMDVLVHRVTAILFVRIPDLSVTTISRTCLTKHMHWPSPLHQNIPVFDQLHEYVHRILRGYKDVPYHNRQHAYHVILSMNKLMDMFLNYDPLSSSNRSNSSPKRLTRPPPTYGIRHDPLVLLALVFSALIHDVEHQGIPNRQLALEDDRLAILYNDQSIAENWSLYVAFSELLQDEFSELRAVM
jgi:hypothetical protein